MNPYVYKIKERKKGIIFTLPRLSKYRIID